MADISAGGVATAPPPDDSGQEAREAAARRFEARTPERRVKIDLLAGGAAVADTPERLAKRTERLRRYGGREQVPCVAAVMRAGPPGTTGEAEAFAGTAMLERVINSADFVDIRYLEAGVAAARAVGRIDIRNEVGRVVGYGTASLVSAHLILTNHHVLPTADVARWSAIEFNYQDGVDGQPLQPRLFDLDPDRFYLADKDKDFALVAVAADEGELAPFGFNRLIGAEGKSVVGEFVTIVQHPKGEKKQVSLRENRVVDVLESFLHYETDTEPGSSGSPVFNDQWEVVALHHASVPAPDHAELGNIMNEGIRVGALLKAARARAEGLPASMRSLFDGLFQDARSAVGTTAVAPALPPSAPASTTPTPTPPVPVPTQVVASTRPVSALQPIVAVDSPRLEATFGTDGLHVTLPVEIILHLGGAPSISRSAIWPVRSWTEPGELVHQIGTADDLML